MVFALADRVSRGTTVGQEDPIRIQARDDLTRALERALEETMEAIRTERATRRIDLIPHLTTNDLENFRVLIQVGSPAPFQVDFLTQEPSGNVLSPIMMTPHRVDPGEKEFVRFQEVAFKPLTRAGLYAFLALRARAIESG